MTYQHPEPAKYDHYARECATCNDPQAIYRRPHKSAEPGRCVQCGRLETGDLSDTPPPAVNGHPDPLDALEAAQADIDERKQPGRLVPRVVAVPVLPIDPEHEALVDRMLAERAAPVTKRPLVPSVPGMVKEHEAAQLCANGDHAFGLGKATCRKCGWHDPVRIGNGALLERADGVVTQEGAATAAQAELEQARRERDGWMDSAAQMGRSVEFYRGIVHQIGDMFGAVARTSDDGSVQDGVLALRVPELVTAARAEADSLRQQVAELRTENERLGELALESEGLRPCGLCRCADQGRCMQCLREKLETRDADVAELRRELAHATQLAEERLAHAHQLQAEIEADQDGRMELRERYGARDHETFGAFVARLLHEGSWRAVGDGAFASPFGTIRACHACGCLVAGGPTACGRCAAATARKEGDHG